MHCDPAVGAVECQDHPSARQALLYASFVLDVAATPIERVETYGQGRPPQPGWLASVKMLSTRCRFSAHNSSRSGTCAVQAVVPALWLPRTSHRAAGPILRTHTP